jgi:hypothetical protein
VHLRHGIVAADTVMDFLKNLAALDQVRTGYLLIFTCLVGCLAAGALVLVSQAVLSAHGCGLHGR